jgi:hypothetical protein
MADIEFRPDQDVPAGRYYVILRPVDDAAPAIVPNNIVEPQILPPEAPGNIPEGPNTNENMGVPAIRPNQPSQNMPNNQMFGGKKGKNTKKVKKSKGTRKLSGYMKFAQEVRPRLLKENPALRTDIPSIGRKIGEMWRNLSANEKARY